MAATVLNSQRAVEVSIYVVRAFVQLREILASNKELAQKLTELERKLASHDQAIVGILKTIRELMQPPEIKKNGQSDSCDRTRKSSALLANLSAMAKADFRRVRF